MATKTIVRYKPPNELIGAREITVEQLEARGIFDHGGVDLVWRKETGFWIDAEEAGLSEAMIDKLVNDEDFGNDRHGRFEVEKQETRESQASPSASANSSKGSEGKN